ncbi:MAG: hypothetical protein Q9M94_05525 [Candidatus Gracilibacteria bacterium]|nr:hypothetical protein [Candidatus Gracilibacteria bacterium]MDQ7022147.1 hypothetical protein [Candidatus Gracilibacteria bacterium]
MRKKIILFLLIFIGSLNISFAYDTYSNPTFSLIRDLVDNNIPTGNNPNIFPDNENATEFCNAFSQNLTGYTNGTGTLNIVGYYNNATLLWEETSSITEHFISEISCSNPINTTSSGTTFLQELDFETADLYNLDSELLEYTPTGTGNTLLFNYSPSLNDINKNLYEIKYILLIFLLLFSIFGFYNLIKSLIGKN